MLYFRFDKAMVDSGYLDNGRTLHHLEEILADCRLCERIDSINILSFASPDGDHSYNERLTHRRSIAVKGYLVWKYPHLDQYRIHSRPQGENWRELRRLIVADEHLPNREEVLQILDRHKDMDKTRQHANKQGSKDIPATATSCISRGIQNRIRIQNTISAETAGSHIPPPSTVCPEN